MGQAEVLKLLEKENRWMTAKEISEKTGYHTSNITSKLKQMLKYSEVLKIEKIVVSSRTFFWRAK